MNQRSDLAISRRTMLVRSASAGLAAWAATGCAPLRRRRVGASEERFRIRVLNRKYDLHRPRGCTLLAIEVADWPGNEFGLWLPETVYGGGEKLWGNWGDDAEQHFTQDERGRWVTRRDFSGFHVVSTLTPDPERSCLWYRHTFHNTGEQTLHQLNTQTCFHLVNAPQFISLRGSRVWANLDGVWMTTDGVERDQSPDPRRVWFLRQGLRDERTIVPQPFPSAIMPQAAHSALLIAENFAGNGCVAIASRNLEKLFNNNDSILRCLHSESLPIDRLEPGQWAHQDSVILFYAGDHEATIEHFVNHIESSWPPA